VSKKKYTQKRVRVADFETSGGEKSGKNDGRRFTLLQGGIEEEGQRSFGEGTHHRFARTKEKKSALSRD